MADGTSHQSTLTAEDGMANPNDSFVPVSMLHTFECLRNIVVGTWEDMLPIFDSLVLSANHHPTPTDNQGSSTSQVTSSVTATTPTASEPPLAVADVSDVSRATAAMIDDSCPKSGSSEDIAMFLMKLWQILLAIVPFCPYDHVAQDQLIGVLESLRSLPDTIIWIEEIEVRLWKDFPLLLNHMRAAWVNPIRKSEMPEFMGSDEENVEQWVNLNAFAARIMNKGFMNCSVFAFTEIVGALEGDLPPNAGLVREYTMSVASRWISICGTRLFEDAFTGNTLTETERQEIIPGPLYVDSGGQPGYSMDRWRFWQSELAEFGNLGLNPICLGASQAAHRMEEIMNQNEQAEASRLGTAQEHRL
ncbi:hypothetical protein BKA56DRAFT_677312 [Ilyonectria sp. MPI-CAGE-AT-0026]|nr:hypothetical protein BKA56DRAFT_677312 [Ilyonectria sp. MPI-CAGE-AT-0026]